VSPLYTIKVSTLGKPKNSIGETKLKILAILSHNEGSNLPSYGYTIWKTLNDHYYSCLGPDGLRNVYHHLDDLCDQQFISEVPSPLVESKPERQLYHLTEKALLLQVQYLQYQKPLTIRD